MPKVQLLNGKPLIVAGKVAISGSCCCGGFPTPTCDSFVCPPEYPADHSGSPTISHVLTLDYGGGQITVSDSHSNFWNGCGPYNVTVPGFPCPAICGDDIYQSANAVTVVTCGDMAGNSFLPIVSIFWCNGHGWYLAPQMSVPGNASCSIVGFQINWSYPNLDGPLFPISTNPAFPLGTFVMAINKAGWTGTWTITFA